MRGFLLVVGLGLLPAMARAEESEREGPVPYTPAVRREGIMVGVAGGLTLNAASGYPNDVSQIGLPEFEATTGLGVSTGGALWLGGALADWLNIGLGAVGGSFEHRGLQASGGSFGLRIEAFPLFSRGGFYQDLGMSFTAGVGGYTLKRGGETVAEGEATSSVGVGALYEGFRFWRISTGPQIEYTHQFSRSLSSHLFIIGWRAAFYGGP
jgi:hypothetical protein